MTKPIEIYSDPVKIPPLDLSSTPHDPDEPRPLWEAYKLFGIDLASIPTPPPKTHYPTPEEMNLLVRAMSHVCQQYTYASGRSPTVIYLGTDEYHIFQCYLDDLARMGHMPKPSSWTRRDIEWEDKKVLEVIQPSYLAVGTLP